MKLFKSENAFLFIAVTFGILMVFITPPFQTPDEPAHFYRAYQISELKILSDKQDNKVGGMLPESLSVTAVKTAGNVPWNPDNKVNTAEIFSTAGIPLNPKNKIFTEFPAMARYSPAAYIPQALGIAAGRLLRLSPLALMYIGRIFNLAVWIFLIYLAIKIMPVSNRLFFLLALTPMSMFIAASLSADVSTNALAFLFIAICLHYTFEENKILKPSGIFVLCLISVLLSLTKLIYFPILLIFLIIPVNKIGTTKKYYTVFTLLILLSLLAITGWFLLVKNLIVPLKPDIFVDRQISFVLHNPLKFFEVVIKSLSSKRYIEHFIGRLGWLDTQMSWFFILPYFLLLIGVALTDINKNILLSLKHKTVIFAALAATLILLCLSQYLTWTPVGKTRIFGLQGRYFIPVAPLIFLLFYPPERFWRAGNQKITLTVNRKNIFLFCVSFCSLAYTIVVLIKRFYI